MPISLTEAEATKVRGYSPTNKRTAIWPVPLKDGTFVLSDALLTSPAHADVAAFLSGLPKIAKKDIPALAYDEDVNPGDDALLEARDIPKLKDAGVRSP